jgi:predicted nucleic acid-binding protein
MSGPIVIVDTNVFISARNRDERGYAPCREFLDRVDRGSFRAIVSTVTIAEIRAGIRASDSAPAWKDLLTHFLTSPSYRVEPLTVEIAAAAGELRATSSLALPDAVIVATGQLSGASCLVTQDRKVARRQTVLKVRDPNELL